jgi:nucleotide-binding universal stress UspA family protein
MVARPRPNGDLDPWKGAQQSTTMGLQARADRAPSNKGIAMSLSPDAILPTTAARDGAPKRRTVVVGYDGSDESRAAVAVAIDRAKPSDRIVLVHATTPASSWLGSPYYQLEVAKIHDAAERILDEMRPIAEQAVMPIEFSVLEGPPAEAIIRAAAVRDADEIVVGSRGLGRIRGALGSVSQELLREAAVPVVVVNRDAADVLQAPALVC